MTCTYDPEIELPGKVIEIVRSDPDRMQFERSLRSVVESGQIAFVYGCRGSGKSYTVNQIFPDFVYDMALGDYKIVERTLSELMNIGKPKILDEIGGLFGHRPDEDQDETIEDLMKLAEGKPLILISDYRNVTNSFVYENSILNNPEFQKNSTMVANPNWSDELVRMVIMEGFGLPEDYAEGFIEVSIGLPRALTLLDKGIKVMEKDPSYKVPPLDHEEVEDLLWSAAEDVNLRNMVHRDIPSVKTIKLLEMLGLIKKAGNNRSVVEIEGQSYVFRSKLFEEVVKSCVIRGHRIGNDAWPSVIKDTY